MPKAKQSTKRKTRSSKSVVKKQTKPAARKSMPTPRASRPAAPQVNYSDEYREYLQRYELSGAGRPRLSPAEFDLLDDELLDLLALETEVGLDDEQIIRLQELEYLLLDSEQ